MEMVQIHWSPLSKTRHWGDLHETHACCTLDAEKLTVLCTTNKLHSQYAVYVTDIQLLRSAYSLYVATSKPSLVQSYKMLGPVITTTNN